MELRSVIISGGGTGGHIFPALAIADAIKARFPDCKILFVGAKGRMEMERIPKAGYEIVGLDIQGLQRSFSLDNLKFPFKVMGSIAKSRKILNEFNPDLAIGVGGYASGPLLFAAARKGIKTLIQEQNSYAGITNKMLGKKANKVCIAYEEAASYFPKGKTVLTGNPVRQALSTQWEQGAAKQKLGFDADKPLVFFVGGSLGARAINMELQHNIARLLEAGIQVYWQTGKYYYQQHKVELDAMAAEYKNLKIEAFVEDMALSYAAANVVVSRAGALAIAELQMLGKASVLVPSPYVAENHQYKNAMALVNRSAAVLVEEKDIAGHLIQTVADLVNDPTKQKQLAKNIKEMELPNAADKLVEEAVALCNGKA